MYAPLLRLAPTKQCLRQPLGARSTVSCESSSLGHTLCLPPQDCVTVERVAFRLQCTEEAQQHDEETANLGKLLVDTEYACDIRMFDQFQMRRGQQKPGKDSGSVY